MRFHQAHHARNRDCTEAPGLPQRLGGLTGITTWRFGCDFTGGKARQIDGGQLYALFQRVDAVPGDTSESTETPHFWPRRSSAFRSMRVGSSGLIIAPGVYRCREVGAVSDPAYQRAYQRLRQLRKLNLFQAEAVDGYPGEIPIMISRAFALAEENGLTLAALARELACQLPRLRLLLGGRRGACSSAASAGMKSNVV